MLAPPRVQLLCLDDCTPCVHIFWEGGEWISSRWPSSRVVDFSLAAEVTGKKKGGKNGTAFFYYLNSESKTLVRSAWEEDGCRRSGVEGGERWSPGKVEREFRRGEEEEEDRRWGGVAANVLCAGHIRGEPSTADHVKRAGESATRLQTR